MKETPEHDAPAPSARGCYTVTEVAEAIRQHLETEFPDISVLGEVANCKVHQSGHVYFTLRDGESMLAAALFRRAASRVAVQPENGMSVVATGRLSHFGGAGRTQIIVSEIAAAGRGGMEMAFRELLERLRAEGLTAEERKRELPAYPRSIALITSPTGAVIRDVLDTLRRRWPVAEIVHVPVEVQGPSAARLIVRAFRLCDAMERLDAVILARGGGSAEDLWTFNLESVARAVAASRHPVVTGIGHEIDTTICDYVSDLRAATPTAAAELVAPRIEDVRRGLEEALRGIARRADEGLENRGQLVEYLLRSGALAAIAHRMERAEAAVDESAERIADLWRELIGGRRAEAVSAEGGLALALERAVARAGSRRLEAALALAACNPRMRLESAGNSLHQIERLLRSRVQSRISEGRARSSGLVGTLGGLDPRSVLKRGYAYCTTPDGSRVVARAARLSSGDGLLVQFIDGGARCRVEEKRKGRPWRKK